ncbi:MAG TPA: NfeD family protein [Acidimicrobiales bacterium]|nr:NfeD family protein [Acidimicrobiales bacterium]
MAVLWVVIAAVFLLGEALTLAFFAVFAAAGAAVAALVAWLGGPLWGQLVVAGALPVAGVWTLRPLLVRSIGRHRSHPSLAAGPAMVGQSALTLDRVGDEHHPGHVLYRGERWLAVTDDPEGLGPDTPVTIVAVRGTTLVVWP